MKLEELAKLVNKYREEYGITYKVKLMYNKDGGLEIYPLVISGESYDKDVLSEFCHSVYKEIVGAKVSKYLVTSKDGIIL